MSTYQVIIMIFEILNLNYDTIDCVHHIYKLEHYLIKEIFEEDKLESILI